MNTASMSDLSLAEDTTESSAQVSSLSGMRAQLSSTLKAMDGGKPRKATKIMNQRVINATPHHRSSTRDLLRSHQVLVQQQAVTDGDSLGGNRVTIPHGTMQQPASHDGVPVSSMRETGLRRSTLRPSASQSAGVSSAGASTPSLRLPSVPSPLNRTRTLEGGKSSPILAPLRGSPRHTGRVRHRRRDQFRSVGDWDEGAPIPDLEHVPSPLNIAQASQSPHANVTHIRSGSGVRHRYNRPKTFSDISTDTDLLPPATDSSVLGGSFDEGDSGRLANDRMEFVNCSGRGYLPSPVCRPSASPDIRLSALGNSRSPSSAALSDSPANYPFAATAHRDQTAALRSKFAPHPGSMAPARSPVHSNPDAKSGPLQNGLTRPRAGSYRADERPPAVWQGGAEADGKHSQTSSSELRASESSRSRSRGDSRGESRGESRGDSPTDSPCSDLRLASGRRSTGEQRPQQVARFVSARTGRVQSFDAPDLDDFALSGTISSGATKYPAPVHHESGEDSGDDTDWGDDLAGDDHGGGISGTLCAIKPPELSQPVNVMLAWASSATASGRGKVKPSTGPAQGVEAQLEAHPMRRDRSTSFFRRRWEALQAARDVTVVTDDDEHSADGASGTEGLGGSLEGFTASSRKGSSEETAVHLEATAAAASTDSTDDEESSSDSEPEAPVNLAARSQDDWLSIMQKLVAEMDRSEPVEPAQSAAASVPVYQSAWGGGPASRTPISPLVARAVRQPNGSLAEQAAQDLEASLLPSSRVFVTESQTRDCAEATIVSSAFAAAQAEGQARRK